MSDAITDTDPGVAQRTQYRNGRRLAAAVLTGDSQASVAAWERHQRTAHTSGIVAGLDVRIEPSLLIVEPGAAIDPFGHLLLVAQQQQRKFINRAGTWLAWLKYSRILK